MEKVLFKSGLCMTNRVLELIYHLDKKNLDRRIEALLSQTGLAIAYGDTGLEDDWKIIDQGSGYIKVKAGVAVFSDYELVKMVNDSSNIAITDDSTTYTVLITKQNSEKEVGTAAVTAGSLTISGTDTKFSEELEVGEWIQFDGTNTNNEVPLIVAKINSNLELIVESLDGNGDPVSFTTESGMDIYSIGRFMNGYPSGSDNNHLRNHDQVNIVVTTSPGGYSPKVIIGTVSNTGGTLTIVDQRETSLMEIKTYYSSIFTADQNLTDTPPPDKYGGGTVWIESETNGTTVVLLDSSIDWRDRWITLQGYLSHAVVTPSTYRPPATGVSLGAMISVDNLANLEDNSQHYIAGALYTANGHATGDICMVFKNDFGSYPADQIRIWVDDGTSFSAGDLVMKKDADLYDEHAIGIRVDFSPKQNHY